MSKHVDYYFTSISPFSYLGHSEFLRVIEQSQSSVCYKPIILREIFAQLGVLPVGERPMARQTYRLLEIERWANKRKLPINLRPAYFPADPSLGDKCVIVLQQHGENPGPLVAKVLAACWAEEKNVADPKVLHSLLSSLGIDADEVITQAQTQQVQAIYAANTSEALNKGVLGAPSYFLDEEQFWGQDRLELLHDQLS